MTVLKHNQQIRVESFRFRKEIIVGTQKGLYKEYNWDFEEKTDQSYAWANQAASCLTADYPGKAAAMQKKEDDYRNAVSVKQGDRVLIDRRAFEVHIIGEQYSDPVHFEEIK